MTQRIATTIMRRIAIPSSFLTLDLPPHIRLGQIQCSGGPSKTINNRSHSAPLSRVKAKLMAFWRLPNSLLLGRPTRAIPDNFRGLA